MPIGLFPLDHIRGNPLQTWYSSVVNPMALLSLGFQLSALLAGE
jgi:hypothetical protein